MAFTSCTKLALLVAALYLASDVSAQTTGSFRKIALPNASVSKAAKFAVSQVQKNPSLLKSLEPRATGIKLGPLSSAGSQVVNGIVYEIVGKVFCTVNKKNVPVNVVMRVSEFPGRPNSMKLLLIKKRK